MSARQKAKRRLIDSGNELRGGDVRAAAPIRTGEPGKGGTKIGT